MEGGNKLLVVICDVNIHWWNSYNDSHDDSSSFQHCMDSILVFCNSYLMLSHCNKLAFIACHADECKFIYPCEDPPPISLENVQNDGKFDLFTEFNEVAQEKIKDFMNKDNYSLEPGAPSLLAGGLTKALCYIHNFDKNIIGPKTISRILVIKGSPDASMHYMSTMNSIFASQKQDVVIDCCALISNSGFMQQASDITSGLYFTVEDLTGLLEYLLWMFLPEPDLRTKLNMPSSVQIDYRAACFCHKRLLDVGFVCSICLSIYCQFVPKCATCHTRFRLPQLPLAAKGKKKKEGIEETNYINMLELFKIRYLTSSVKDFIHFI